jgi:hypothetical protein
MPATYMIRILAGFAVTLLLPGCGGNSGGPAPEPSAASPVTLQLGGTAAIGGALSQARIEVRCAAGIASTTTTSSGHYSVVIPDAALPCLVEAKAPVQGRDLTLHSIARTGTLELGHKRATATANVTSVTEMILAHLTGRLPSDTFTRFPGEPISAERLADATGAVLAALKGAGIDLGSIDPLQGELIAASDAGPGNAHDQLLDALGARVPARSLPFLVNAIAAAAAAPSEDGLRRAMTAVSGGSLPGCPVALSGDYRTVDLEGRLVLRVLDFAAMQVRSADGAEALDIIPEPGQPCEFTARGTADSQPVEWEVAFGPQGAGAFRFRHVDVPASVVNGFIFPAQSHAYADFSGTWLFAGSDPWAYGFGRWTLGAERQVSRCEYSWVRLWTCRENKVPVLRAEDRSDGGIDLAPVPGQPSGSLVLANLYAYRAPNGELALYGSGPPGNGVGRRIVAAPSESLRLPAAGTVTRYWQTSLVMDQGAGIMLPTTRDAEEVVADSAATHVVTLRRLSDGREQEAFYNSPINGLYASQMLQFPLQNFGITSVAPPFPMPPITFGIRVDQP